MQTLACCDSCGRHVRIADSRCPFCEAELPGGRGEPPRAVAGLSRAAVLAGATALAAGLGGCPSQSKDVNHGNDGLTSTTPDGGPGDQNEELRRQQEMEEHYRHRRSCDQCPYGAPPPPADRVVV